MKNKDKKDILDFLKNGGYIKINEEDLDAFCKEMLEYCKKEKIKIEYSITFYNVFLISYSSLSRAIEIIGYEEKQNIFNSKNLCIIDWNDIMKQLNDKHKKFEIGDVVTPRHAYIAEGKPFFIVDYDKKTDRYKIDCKLLRPIESEDDLHATQTSWYPCELEKYCSDTNTEIKEKENKKMEKILEIYEDKKIKEIEQKYDKQLIEVVNNDPITVYVKQAEEALKEMLKTEKLTIIVDTDVVQWTQETREKRDEIIETIQKEKQKLNQQIVEIEALLELAPNYEEKVQILKDYGIMDRKKNVIL